LLCRCLAAAVAAAGLLSGAPAAAAAPAAAGTPAAASSVEPAVVPSTEPAAVALARAAVPAERSAPPPPTRLCVVTDRRLTELSGLATDGADRRWAISDGGSRAQVFELAADCSVRRVLTGSVNPYDVEDLARAPDGTFWLADTGDNNRNRGTVAMIKLTPTGVATVLRMRFPDGPHDAEAVLLGRDGVPLIVTKEPLAPAGVYRPERPLAAGVTVPLRRVGEVSLPSSDTVGGPIGRVGSRTVTGGATTADGRVAALRTYTDAWLFSAPDGDLVAALDRPPLRVPLPDEPQGEAIAFDGKGGLLSGSEGRDGVRGGLRVVPGAAALTTDGTVSSADRDQPDSTSWSTLRRLLGVVAVVLVGGLGLLAWRRARR
jgi:hypothetical protein